jgi:tRNA(Arg) A34 adenosine deaminase TadA
MRRAIEVARGNPDAPFGAVIVERETGEVVAEGLNRAEKNPVWHGEIGAIINCAENRPGVDWTRLVLYTTAEPCPMCSGAILWSGIPHLVYGTSTDTLIDLGFPPLDLRIAEIASRASFAPPEITAGVLEEKCDALYEEMVRRTGDADPD